MPLADGQVVAGYTILRTLGAGGMGEVYLVQHPRLPRYDALKVLGSAVSSDEEYRQRFNLEADMVAMLSNPHIVTIYDRGEFDDKLWIAMEYIDGTDASRLLADRYPYGMPPDEVVRIITGVADALDYAHSRGLLHRDVKPANILLGVPGTGDERVMLADFGIARWMGQASGLTGTNMTVGTVAYAAPEQLKGEDIDGHADQYALAATAYHLLTGMPPFTHTNPAIVISQHLSSDPPAIGTKRPELACLSPVFARALAKDADKRYRRCADFARALAQGLGTAEQEFHSSDVTSQALAVGQAVRPGRARHAKSETTSSRRRLAIPAILGAVVVIAGAAAGLSLLLGHHKVDSAATAQTAHPAAPPPAVSGRMDLPVVVIGANCAVLGAAAVSESGAPAYCAHAAPGADATVWSLQPEKLRSDPQTTTATP
ncbi:serine/threonine-protein kinase [Mycobacterium sp. CVI_P3]|uniref:non-specific serine/threonine protein kinase n=1 Tax=Mycobacterium pinniadriaticum TaxID=2994102 RepID=A0ABT3SFX5_9MYCO|nr:serine/threonine-protein kinase [Mycobacterium pinniadriaticum]MCX2931954.1 serine/threonine-protein kinase [Mycobacterium pinniadriaticum]MCX2938378.1 serine/threonine-protein kinase [Mycobacterium pinniadriaticum]